MPAGDQRAAFGFDFGMLTGGAQGEDVESRSADAESRGFDSGIGRERFGSLAAHRDDESVGAARFGIVHCHFGHDRAWTHIAAQKAGDFTGFVVRSGGGAFPGADDPVAEATAFQIDQVWDKLRFFKQGQQMLGGYREFFWQPTSLALLKSGEVVVCHDGGYVRLPTDRDKELAGNDEKLAERLLFYDVCDYVSRLSPVCWPTVATA